MKNIKNFPIEVLEKGFYLDQGRYKCIHCGASFLSGEVFRDENRYFDAEKMAEQHVIREHISAFDALVSLDKKETGLSDVQRRILIDLYNRVPDGEIAKKTKTSLSAVRFQRYSFREKARQARIILALSELLEEKLKNSRDDEAVVHKGATMVDERYMTDSEEEKRIIAQCFSSLEPLMLKNFSAKEKKKLVILRVIASCFERNRRYSEKEVNEKLKGIYEKDYVTLRRYLIEYGFMDRTRECSEYWLK